METLIAVVKKGPEKANYIFRKRRKVTEFVPVSGDRKTKKRIKLFKLNSIIFNAPRKSAKSGGTKKQLLIGNKLRDLFRFKNLKDTAIALNTSEANLNNLNTGKAGAGLSNAYRCVIAFAEEISPRKRKEILANINFDKTFSNT